MLTAIVFVGRPHAASVERTYELNETELIVSEGGRLTMRVPLSQITQVALSYMGMGDGQTYCNAKTRGSGTIHIRSHHFGGLGQFEDRHESFDPFVSELCRRIAKQNPQATFVRGNWSYFMIWVGVGLAAAALAIGCLMGGIYQFGADGTVAPDVVMGAIVGGGLAFATLGAARANRVVPFDPNTPPVVED